MNAVQDDDEAYHISRNRKILDWFFDTVTPSFFIEHIRTKLSMVPNLCGGISETAKATLFNDTERSFSSKTGAGAGAGAGASSSASSYTPPLPFADLEMKGSNLRRSPRTKQPKADDDAVS
jgi:hypothetical protein